MIVQLCNILNSCILTWAMGVIAKFYYNHFKLSVPNSNAMDEIMYGDKQ